MKVNHLVGRKKEQEPQSKQVWLVQSQIIGTSNQLWLTAAHPVETAEDAESSFQMYRARWTIEDAFKFIKQGLGCGEVKVLALDGLRFLVVMVVVAAGLPFSWGVALEREAVQLLAAGY